MKKLNLMFVWVILFGAIGAINAQELQVPLFDENADADLSIGRVRSIGTPKALWDIQFNYDVTALTGTQGMAGVCHYKTGNELWVSKWGSDTMFIFSENGMLNQTFLISGLSGVRALTTDGNYIYAANNSSTIYRINPTTKLLAPPHITSASSNTVRHCSYDPTANSGTGGFWVGNFNTDIELINMSGTVTNSITAATHTLSGMYGSAVDTFSSGGPYLWLFTQMSPNNCQIYRLQLSSGTVANFSHDVMSDVGAAQSLTSGLAGGLFISDGIIAGEATLGGIVQGTPNNLLFGYELSNPVQAVDLTLTDLRPLKGYTKIPLTQIFAEGFSTALSNIGTVSADTAYVDFYLRKDGILVWNDRKSALNLATTANLTSVNYLPSGIGTYTLEAIAKTGNNQNDPFASNDTMRIEFEVSDSVFARDNNIPNASGYTVSGTEWAYVVAKYNLQQADSLTGIHISIETPVANDTTFAVIARSNGGVPDSVLFLGEEVIIQAGVQDYWLRVPNGYNLLSGDHFLGCYEVAVGGINLKQSDNFYLPGVNYFYIPVQGWTESGIQTARFIRPCFANYTAVATTEISSDINFTIFPNPTADQLFVRFENAELSKVEMELISSNGQIISRRTANPKAELMSSFNMTELPSGTYFLRISSAEGQKTYPVLKR